MKRSRIALALAFVFVLLAGLVAWFGDDTPDARQAPSARDFPRMDATSRERAGARRTHVVKYAFIGAKADDAKEVKRDPFLLSFPPDAKTALVIEARELLDTPVGELLTRCIVPDQDALDEMIDETGANWFDIVDRIGTFDSGDGRPVFMAEGEFSDVMAKMDESLGGHFKDGETYGDSGRLYHYAESEGEFAEKPDEVFAIWDNRINLTGPREAVEAAIDRLEGRSISEKSAIEDHQAYGEMYGFLPPEELVELLPRELRDVIGIAERAEIHLDAPDDVFLVVDVVGEDPQMDDLGRTVASALSVARFGAKLSDNQDLVDLLDLARVSASDDGFSVDAAFPLDIIAKHLAEQCPAPDKETVQAN